MKLTEAQKNTLAHYIELARRKKNPALKFACGLKSDLFLVAMSLQALGLAVVEGLPDDDPRDLAFFRITDAGRAALLPPEPTPEPSATPAPTPNPEE